MFRLDSHSLRKLRRLADDLNKLARIVEQECRAEFRLVAVSVANEARSTAPRLSGNLRDSINDISIGPDRDIAVIADVPYAAITNKGGRHPVFGRGSVTQPATNFMTNAVQAHENDFMDAANRALESAARKIGFD
jgi:phage gpG-like protein